MPMTAMPTMIKMELAVRTPRKAAAFAAFAAAAFVSWPGAASAPVTMTTRPTHHLHHRHPWRWRYRGPALRRQRQTAVRREATPNADAHRQRQRTRLGRADLQWGKFFQTEQSTQLRPNSRILLTRYLHQILRTISCGGSAFSGVHERARIERPSTKYRNNAPILSLPSAALRAPGAVSAAAV